MVLCFYLGDNTPSFGECTGMFFVIVESQEGERALEHLHKSTEQSQGLSEAVQHKEKLLDFDQTTYVEN